MPFPQPPKPGAEMEKARTSAESRISNDLREESKDSSASEKLDETQNFKAAAGRSFGSAMLKHIRLESNNASPKVEKLANLD